MRPLIRLALSLLLLAPGLSAQDPALRESLIQGKALWATQGDREGATAKFEQVIAALEPKGRSLDAAWTGVLSEAYNWLAVLDDRSAARKARVPKHLEALLDLNPDFELDRSLTNARLLAAFDALRAGRLAKVKLTLEPADGILTVDGKPRSASPAVKFLPPGSHTLAYSKPGFQPLQQQVELALKEPRALDFKLVRSSSTVAVHTFPVGAQVLLDGKPLGTTSGVAPAALRPFAEKLALTPEQLSAAFVVDGLAAGEHILEVRAPCYRPRKLRLGPDYATPYADHELEPVKLEPSHARLSVRCPVPGELFLDGRSLGPVPVKELQACPGSYTLQVRFPAGGFSRPVTLAEDASLTVDAAPRPRLAYLGFEGQEPFAGRERLLGLLEKLETRLAGVAWIPPVPGETVQAALARLRANREAELVLSARPLPGKPIHQVELCLATLNPGEEERLVVKPLEQDPLGALAARLEAIPPLREAWAGIVLADIPGEAGPLVLQAGAASTQAGLRVGKPLLQAAGKPVASVAAFRELLARTPGTLQVGQGEAPIPLTVTLQGLELPLDAPALSYPFLLAELRLRQAGAKGDDLALLRLNQALALMHFRLYDRAMEVLRDTRMEATEGVSQGTLDYYTGLCLLRMGSVYLAEAQQAFRQALKYPKATIFGPEGPFVAPLAKQALADLKP